MYADALINIGMMDLGRGARDSATAYFHRVLAVDSTNGRAAAGMGMVLLERGDAAAAVPLLEPFAEVGGAPALMSLGQALLQVGRTAGGAAAFQRAIDLDPSRTDLMVYAASALIEHQQAALAEPYLAEAMQRMPKSGVIIGMLSLAHADMGRNDDAIREAETAVEYAGKDIRAFVFVGRAMRDAHRPDLAEKYLTAEVERFPGRRWMRNGSACQYQGRHGKARGGTHALRQGAANQPPGLDGEGRSGAATMKSPARTNSQSPGSFPGQRGWFTIGIGMLVCLYSNRHIFASSGAPHGPQLLDDRFAIQDNPSITDLWSITGPLHPPAGTPVAGRPVVNYSLAFNYWLNGALGVDQRPDQYGANKTVGYHVVNLVLHIACGLLLLGIVRRTLRGGRVSERWKERADSVALLVAAIWMLHPLQTDAVDYLIQRTELIVALCYLATLYCSIRAWDADRPARWLWGGVIACLLGMASKEVMVSVLLMIVLYDRAFRFTLMARDGEPGESPSLVLCRAGGDVAGARGPDAGWCAWRHGRIQAGDSVVRVPAHAGMGDRPLPATGDPADRACNRIRHSPCGALARSARLGARRGARVDHGRGMDAGESVGMARLPGCVVLPDPGAVLERGTAA